MEKVIVMRVGEKFSGVVLYRTVGGFLSESLETLSDEDSIEHSLKHFLGDFLKCEENLGIVFCKGINKEIRINKSILDDFGRSVPENVKYLIVSYHYGVPCFTCGGKDIFYKRKKLANELRVLRKIDSNDASITLQLVGCGLNESSGNLHFASEQKWDIDEVKNKFSEEDSSIQDILRIFAPQEIRRFLEVGVRF